MAIKLYPFTLEVLAPPGWFLTLSSSNLAVDKGITASLNVTATREAGLTADHISLYVIGLPVGTGVSINPYLLTVAAPTALVEIQTWDMQVGPPIALKILGLTDDYMPYDGMMICGNDANNINGSIAAIQNLGIPVTLYCLANGQRWGFPLRWGTAAQRPVASGLIRGEGYWATDTQSLYRALTPTEWGAYPI